MIEDDEGFLAVNASFPQKLYALMHNSEITDDSVGWLNHGKSFRIINADRFAAEVIPRYFKHAKLTSFQRQLNLYGFRRITKGDDQGAYYHPKFQYERQDLLDDIRRLPNKSSNNNSEKTNFAYYESSTNGYNRSGGFNLNNHSSLSNSNTNNMMSINTRGSRSISSSTVPNMMTVTTRKSSGLLTSKLNDINNNSSLEFSNSDLDESNDPSLQIPLPRKMSKLSMNIGFGRDLRQGWLKPPVKRRRLIDIEESQIQSQQQQQQQHHHHQPSMQSLKDEEFLPSSTSKSDSLSDSMNSPFMGIKRVDSGFFPSFGHTTSTEDLTRIDSTTWDIPDIDDLCNFSDELFA